MLSKKLDHCKSLKQKLSQATIRTSVSTCQPFWLVPAHDHEIVHLTCHSPQHQHKSMPRKSWTHAKTRNLQLVPKVERKVDTQFRDRPPLPKELVLHHNNHNDHHKRSDRHRKNRKRLQSPPRGNQAAGIAVGPLNRKRSGHLAKKPTSVLTVGRNEHVKNQLDVRTGRKTQSPMLLELMFDLKTSPLRHPLPGLGKRGTGELPAHGPNLPSMA